MLNPKLLEDLELVRDGIPIVRLTFGVTLYAERPLSTFREGLLKAYERFLAMVGTKTLRFYATETMRQHKPIAKKSLGMLTSWFSPDAPPSESYGLELHDAEQYNAAPRTMFEIDGTEQTAAGRLQSASMVRYVLPPEWGTDRTSDALDLAKELCSLIPFRSGHAGFAFECSRYFVEPAGEHAFAKSMRHPGIDIHMTHKDCNAVRFDGVRGVGWLTLLDNAFIKQLRSPSFERCKLVLVPNGVMIKAGDAPALGNVNRGDTLPAYREAFRYVRPLTEKAFARSPWFSLATDQRERTLRWYQRFSDE